MRAAEDAIRERLPVRVRVLAVDYGSARTGVAVSDETGTLARPVGVVAPRPPSGGDGRAARDDRRSSTRSGSWSACRSRCAARTGAQAVETLEFVAELAARCSVPVETYDERFTTTLAAASGGPDDDAVAAAHLLEGYLTRLAG